MQILNENRPEWVSPAMRHKPILGHGNSAPRMKAKASVNLEALEVDSDEIEMDEDYESYTNDELDTLIAKRMEIAELFSPTRCIDDSWTLVSQFNCTRDSNGTCIAHDNNIRIQCHGIGGLLRATVICWLLDYDIKNR